MIAFWALLVQQCCSRDQDKTLNLPKIQRKSRTDRFLLDDDAPPCFYGSLRLTNGSYELSAMICLAL